MKDVETWSPQKAFHFITLGNRYDLGSNTIKKKRDYIRRNQPCRKRVAEARTLVWATRLECWAAQDQGTYS